MLLQCGGSVITDPWVDRPAGSGLGKARACTQCSFHVSRPQSDFRCPGRIPGSARSRHSEHCVGPILSSSSGALSAPLTPRDQWPPSDPSPHLLSGPPTSWRRISQRSLLVFKTCPIIGGWTNFNCPGATDIKQGVGEPEGTHRWGVICVFSACGESCNCPFRAHNCPLVCARILGVEEGTQDGGIPPSCRNGWRSQG